MKKKLVTRQDQITEDLAAYLRLTDTLEAVKARITGWNTDPIGTREPEVEIEWLISGTFGYRNGNFERHWYGLAECGGVLAEKLNDMVLERIHSIKK